MSNVCGIYLLRNTVNGKLYVGQSVHTGRRWHEHKKSAARGDKSPLYNSIRKYGCDAFEFVVVEVCDPLKLDEREEFWFSFYDVRNPSKGYNILPAGQNGRVMDEATRKWLSDSMRGRKLAPETIEKIRATNTGRKHSEATKKKQSLAHIGKVVSPHTGQKISQAVRERWATMSEEEKAEYAKARSGYTHSAQAKAKMSLCHKGVPKSAETRERMRKAFFAEPPEVKERRLAALREATQKRWAQYRAQKEGAH